MKKTIVRTLAAAIAVMAFAAMADWDPGDFHIMGNDPQLPDENGTDIDITGFEVADDWSSATNDYVRDIHFWVSWQRDNVEFNDIASLTLTMYDDGVNAPGNEKWTRTFVDEPQAGTGNLDLDMVETRFWAKANQYWWTPGTPWPDDVDHENFYQVNVVFDDLDDWIDVDAGVTYWLGITATLADGSNTDVGWKTTHDGPYDTGEKDSAGNPIVVDYPDYRWGHDAVYREVGDGTWTTIDDIGMSMVITPEPASGLMFALGGLLVFAGRRRRS